MLSPASQFKGEGEACFHKALEVAQHQQSKSLELRAATIAWPGSSSSRGRAEARELLAPVYNWFTEGFDTQDLKDAKTLLEKLAEG